MAKFTGILDNATRADSIVKDKYGSNREAMVLLGKSEAEITAAIPVAGSQAAVASGSQVRGRWVGVASGCGQLFQCCAACMIGAGATVLSTGRSPRLG